MKTAALIYGNDDHYLDHLAPLSSILEIPLIVTEASIQADALAFYPDLSVIHMDYLTIAHDLLLEYDQLFCCMPRPLIDELFFFAQLSQRKRLRTIWCPHGNSDKGSIGTHQLALQQEEAALLYGPQMASRIAPIFPYALTGNFRYAFYLAHQVFYDNLAKNHIFNRLPPNCRQVLYAPTWEDYEKSGTFFEATPHLIDHLPPDTNLLIKIHPNLLKQKPLELEAFISAHQNHPHLLFLTRFPPIYPILKQIDLYIGDTSSIGYDFLTFNRPLVLFNAHPLSPLAQCGSRVTPSDNPYIPCNDFAQKITSLYHEAFGSTLKSVEHLKRDIKVLYAF